MGRPERFRFEVQKSGDVVILHNDRVAATLRGKRAAGFLDAVAATDGQELMARLTGNYKRGNERVAADHPRHRPRGSQ
jgi:hypothetical protein